MAEAPGAVHVGINANTDMQRQETAAPVGCALMHTCLIGYKRRGIAAVIVHGLM